MSTKVRAAQLAARSGAVTVIASGRQPEVITRIVQGEPLGTLLRPDQAPMAARKRWLEAAFNAALSDPDITAEFAALPRPWQRMPSFLDWFTIRQTVRK